MKNSFDIKKADQPGVTFGFDIYNLFGLGYSGEFGILFLGHTGSSTTSHYLF
jgi:hypothetical protein